MRALPLGPNVRILAADKVGLIALEKPEGILAHPNTEKANPRALLNAPYNEEKEAYIWEGQLLYLLHRLDSPTSGVILIGLNPKIATYVREAFEQGLVNKTYHAIVHGCPAVQPKQWSDRLITERKHSELRTRTGPNKGIVCKTLHQVVKKNPDLNVSLLKLCPITGRTHQLRVQCHLHYAPIVGDKTYGDFPKNRDFEKATGEKRLFLHSTIVSLPLPKEGEFVAEAPLPEVFKTCINAKL